MINGAYYAGKLRRLPLEIPSKIAGKLTCDVLLFQDNTPARTSQVTRSSSTEVEFEILPHSQYSPDMAPVPKTEITSSWSTVWKQ